MFTVHRGRAQQRLIYRDPALTYPFPSRSVFPKGECCKPPSQQGSLPFNSQVKPSQVKPSQHSRFRCARNLTNTTVGTCHFITHSFTSLSAPLALSLLSQNLPFKMAQVSLEYFWMFKILGSKLSTASDKLHTSAFESSSGNGVMGNRGIFIR